MALEYVCVDALCVHSEHRQVHIPETWLWFSSAVPLPSVSASTYCKLLYRQQGSKAGMSVCLEGTLRDHSELVHRCRWGMTEARMQGQDQLQCQLVEGRQGFAVLSGLGGRHGLSQGKPK